MTRTVGTKRVARDARGAAVVEFALVCSLLFTVLIGLLQYGLYFNDALGARSGVREAVRQGAVANFSYPAPCASPATKMLRLKCYTDQQIDAISGQTAVRVVKPSSAWAKGKTIRVCAVVKSDGVVGLLPLPNKGFILTKTEMSIEEVPSPLPDGTATTQDADPTGKNWSWCPAVA